MYGPLWRAVTPHLSVARMRADVAAFYELSRWSSSDKINALARLIAARMAEAGLDDVRLIKAPSGGTASRAIHTRQLPSLDGTAPHARP